MNGNNNNNNSNNDNITPAALLEQLVYVDTFMPEIDDASQLDERLAAELSAFADDSFVFPDEDKPKNNNDDLNDHDHDFHNNNSLIDRFGNINGSFSHSSSNINNNNTSGAKRFTTLQQSSFNTGISNILSPLSAINNNSTTNSSSLQHQQNNNQQQGSLNTSDLLSNLPKVHVPPGAQSSLIAAGLSQTQIDALAALVAQHQGLDTPASSNGNDSSSASSIPFNSQDQSGIFKTSSVNPSITPSLASTVNTPSLSPKFTSSRSSTNTDLDKINSIKVETTGDVDVDKRKRNTAASARFRIKKKLKEQQLERSVRELNELTITLEKKIQTLEMENKLLRNLVVEKGEQRNNDELEQLRKRAKLSTNSTQINGSFDNFDEQLVGSNDLNALVKNEGDFGH